MPEVMQALEWKTPRRLRHLPPGAQLLSVCAWPGEYRDDPQSRFINERVHANIQKDGTFSVVPRMWGGVTNAKELRAIADVADKFDIPTVKVTGGQRIDLLGVRKDRLPAVWARSQRRRHGLRPRLRQGLRTVKTCVGIGMVPLRHAGFHRARRQAGKIPVGLLDARQGQDRASPAARAIAPRRPCKDVGVVCVDTGYEIMFAGAAGLDIMGTELLAKRDARTRRSRSSPRSCSSIASRRAICERIYKWGERVGVDSDPRAGRRRTSRSARLYRALRRLASRFSATPGPDRARGMDAHEFAPLAELASIQATE